MNSFYVFVIKGFTVGYDISNKSEYDRVPR